MPNIVSTSAEDLTLFPSFG